MTDPNDTTPDGTVEETTETEETADIEPMTIEELMALNEEDYEEFTENANHTGMKPLHEWLHNVPEDVRKHVANLRSSYTRKTQEIADMRRELEQERKALLAQQDLTVNNPYLKETQKHLETDEEYDLYTQEGMQKEIKRQAAKMLQEMMQPAQQEIQLKQRQMQLQEFKNSNPELTQDEYRLPIAKMLMERPELKLEDAFYIVKAKVDSEKARAEREQMAQQRASRKDTLTKTSNGKSVSPSGTPKFRDAWEAFQYHKAQQERK
jgi:hypothetical protein